MMQDECVLYVWWAFYRFETYPMPRPKTTLIPVRVFGNMLDGVGFVAIFRPNFRKPIFATTVNDEFSFLTMLPAYTNISIAVASAAQSTQFGVNSWGGNSEARFFGKTENSA